MPLLVLATVLDTLALGALILRPGTTPCFLVAGALHLLAVGAAGFPTRCSRSQRALMAALTLTLPLVGAPIAILTFGTRRRGEVGQVPAPEAPEPRPLTVADVNRLTNALSACESLLSGSPDERSATLGMLGRHPDAASIDLLRRAVAGSDMDLAVEAALVLEDLGAQLETRAAAAHLDLEENRGFVRALADADALAEAVHSGLPDASFVPSLVADARRGYERAAALLPGRLPEMASRWVRLELDAFCPEAGIAVLDRAVAMDGSERFAALRVEVVRVASRSGPTTPTKVGAEL